MNGAHQERAQLPYASQCIDEKDILAVVEALRSAWLTTGPKVADFEQALADFVEAKEAVCVSSGTAALHAAMYAVGIEPGDEVILPPMTFAATANAVVFQGGIPVFSDIDAQTLLLDPDQVESKITGRTKAIVAVDYAGQPCNYDALRRIADKHHLALVADACHALGAEYKEEKVGSLADLSTFSFHPVKHITTGEGGMVTTESSDFAHRMKIFRNHGITADHHERKKEGSWFYEMVHLGYNYRMTDFQCALGISQLQKLPHFLQQRRRIAKYYDEAFDAISEIIPLAVGSDILHAYHLYVIRIDFKMIGMDRRALMGQLWEKGLAVNVHYIPVHLHPFYRERFKTTRGLCPKAEAAYEQIISLPMFPGMTDGDVEKVITAIMECIHGQACGALELPLRSGLSPSSPWLDSASISGP
ncbi:MAG: UDP-4-amino-4,6-dideoxy-N-acetyl-beta-L-altrosamine transaminase [Thermodesulfobacteriota bacterium]|nr:UDP-4-amino-4,6-dideoxy-N-acetyl-beta-L-altrosamine transaminase [Thermodesulfobacteriota bacterium]